MQIRVEKAFMSFKTNYPKQEDTDYSKQEDTNYDPNRKRHTLHSQIRSTAALLLQQDEKSFSSCPATSLANGNAIARPVRSHHHAFYLV